jgi:hypothetical protein
MIYEPSRRGRRDDDLDKRDDMERVRALERELQKARQMYEAVVGFQGRVKWRRQIENLQEELRKLTEALGKQAAAKPKEQAVAAK